VQPSDLQKILQDLPRSGRLVKDRGYRQVWRFEQAGQPYYLKYYPRRGLRLKHMLLGSAAMREFRRLQWLQKAGIPAPRAVAALLGLRINDTLGDCVLLQGIEPAVPLDDYLAGLALRGESAPDHRHLVNQALAILEKMQEAKLTHTDLHLGNFLLQTDSRRLYLIDGYAVRKGEPRYKDLLLLGHSAGLFATTNDLRRGWRMFYPEQPLPFRNTLSPKLWAKFLTKITGENRYFGRLRSDGWSGHFFKQTKQPRRWSQASHLHVTREQWAEAWPLLLGQIQRGELETIKRTPSGEVLAAEVTLGGRRVPVIVKHPRRKYWHRYINEIGRGVRARRAWGKAWNLLIRDFATAWPLLLMEKRVLGYVTDAVIVFERVPGVLLSQVDLDVLGDQSRQTLFHRIGRTLRRLERDGLYHWDAKSSNWIIREDLEIGPIPMMIDVDGIRIFKNTGDALQRLLRSMQQHPQYTPADSLWLCRGYAPFAPLVRGDGPATDAASAPA
jgi:tRNA A-37 threonylcarbamoyl transferase component Bud32